MSDQRTDIATTGWERRAILLGAGSIRAAEEIAALARAVAIYRATTPPSWSVFRDAVLERYADAEFATYHVTADRGLYRNRVLTGTREHSSAQQ
jgi:hypothetical protein